MFSEALLAGFLEYVRKGIISYQILLYLLYRLVSTLYFASTILLINGLKTTQYFIFTDI